MSSNNNWDFLENQYSKLNLEEFSKIDKLHDDAFDPHDVIEEDLSLELLHRVQVLLLLRVQSPDCCSKCAPYLTKNIKLVLDNLLFLSVGPTIVGHLFDHFLWSIFQSVVKHNELLYTLQITVQYENGSGQLRRVRHYTTTIQIYEKHSPLPGFKPGTHHMSQSSSWCATNWAVQAWIWIIC